MRPVGIEQSDAKLISWFQGCSLQLVAANGVCLLLATFETNNYSHYVFYMEGKQKGKH